MPRLFVAASAVAMVVCLGAPAANAAERMPATSPASAASVPSAASAASAASRFRASIPVISDATLKTAVIGLDYTATVPGSGTGTPIFTTAGPLPPGLVLTPSGAVTGKPTVTNAASFSFVVRITNSDGSATATITIPVRSAIGPSVASGTLAPATIGSPYSQKVIAGGDGVLTIAALSPLPPGLSLAPSGVISGTPLATTQKSFDVKVRVTSDSVIGSSDATITIPISNPLTVPAITSAAPAAGVVGQPYTFAVEATGEPRATFAVTTGVLPRGLQLDAQTGVISGTPLEAGTAQFTISATNAAGATSAELTISIAAPPVTTTPRPSTTGSNAGGSGGNHAAGGSALAETGASLTGVAGGSAALAVLLSVLGGIVLTMKARARGRFGSNE